jgi:PAS domain-containing protein
MDAPDLVDFRLSVIGDETGDLLGFVTLTRDLTEQKRNLEKLWRSQNRFQRAVESAPNAMIMINRAGPSALSMTIRSSSSRLRPEAEKFAAPVRSTWPSTW